MGNIIPILNLGARISAAHNAVVDGAWNTLERAAECGRLLIEAKNTAIGGWLPWLSANTSISDRQAQKYMQLAVNWAQIQSKVENAPSGAVLGINDALKLIPQPKREPEPKPSRQDIDDDHRVYPADHNNDEIVGEPEEIDDVKPEHYRAAFIMRCEDAKTYASDCAGLISRMQRVRGKQELVSMARATADAWDKLAQLMENEL